MHKLQNPLVQNLSQLSKANFKVYISVCICVLCVYGTMYVLYTCMLYTQYVCLHTYMCIYNFHAYLHAYKHSYIYAHTYMDACMHTFIYACVYIYTNVYMHTYTFIHTYMSLYRGFVLVRRGFCPGVFCLEGFVRIGFCKFPLLSEYKFYTSVTTESSISISGFVCMITFLKCDITCSWPSPCHKLSHLLGPLPLEHDILYMDGPYLKKMIGITHLISFAIHVLTLYMLPQELAFDLT